MLQNRNLAVALMVVTLVSVCEGKRFSSLENANLSTSVDRKRQDEEQKVEVKKRVTTQKKDMTKYKRERPFKVMDTKPMFKGVEGAMFKDKKLSDVSQLITNLQDLRHIALMPFMGHSLPYSADARGVPFKDKVWKVKTSMNDLLSKYPDDACQRPSGTKSEVEWCASLNVQATSRGDTVMTSAAMSGSSEIFQKLLDRKDITKASHQTRKMVFSRALATLFYPQDPLVDQPFFIWLINSKSEKLPVDAQVVTDLFFEIFQYAPEPVFIGDNDMPQRIRLPTQDAMKAWKLAIDELFKVAQERSISLDEGLKIELFNRFLPMLFHGEYDRFRREYVSYDYQDFLLWLITSKSDELLVFPDCLMDLLHQVHENAENPPWMRLERGERPNILMQSVIKKKWKRAVDEMLKVAREKMGLPDGYGAIDKLANDFSYGPYWAEDTKKILKKLDGTVGFGSGFGF